MMSTSYYLTSRLSSLVPARIKRPLLRSSTLGRFVRKCQLEYIKLDFSAARLLWTLFKSLKAPSIESLYHIDAQFAGEDVEETFGFHIPNDLRNAPFISNNMNYISDLDRLYLT